MTSPFVDIHCHMLPGIDDGAKDHGESIAMAQLAVDEGFRTVVVTPHQLGGYACNTGDDIRGRVLELQQQLNAAGVSLEVLPGADVRIDNDMLSKLASGEVLSVADKRKHVLLELPHELYMPLEPVLDGLSRLGMTGVLTHPERNGGILKQPGLVEPLVERGCLMQVTAGSLTGTFGPASQSLAEQMCRRGLVHFLATDAHGAKSRRPKMRDAFARATELAGERAATTWCCENPALAARGAAVPAGVVQVQAPRRSAWSFWKKAG